MSHTTEKTLTDQITSTPEGMRKWQQERAIFEITERICELMAENQVSRADLAEKLGTSRGYISQLLNGASNMTIRKICDVFLALGRQFHAEDRPIDVRNEPTKAAADMAAIFDCDSPPKYSIADSIAVADTISQIPPNSEEHLAA